MTNASNVIFPDKDNGVWVDDPNDGLPREPFVASTDRMINGSWPIFRTLPARQAISWPWVQLDWLREDGGGNWYRSEQSCFVIARGPAEPRSI